MQINSINSITNFRATIPETKGHEKFKEILASQNDLPMTYDEFCKGINEILPNKTDTVDIKNTTFFPREKLFGIKTIVKTNGKTFDMLIINKKEKIAQDIINMIHYCQTRGTDRIVLIKRERLIGVQDLLNI